MSKRCRSHSHWHHGCRCVAVQSREGGGGEHSVARGSPRWLVVGAVAVMGVGMDLGQRWDAVNKLLDRSRSARGGGAVPAGRAHLPVAAPGAAGAPRRKRLCRTRCQY